MLTVALALFLDAILPEPDRLWQRIGHPVVWIGRMIDGADKGLNRGSHRRLRGAFGLLAVLIVTVGPAILVTMALGSGLLAILIEALIGSIFLAHRSLHIHVRAVFDAPDLPTARKAVSMIVGRETASLDDAGVSRAAIEALSESLCDGVVAPAFWFAVLGLPGLVAYKVVNTADSMIGHRTPRHEEFGFAAARLDDLLNLVPSRLTALLTVGLVPPLVWQSKSIIAEARSHVSPNAGWPEATFAHALGIALGGPRRYGTRTVNGVWLNPTGREAKHSDIGEALWLSRAVGVLQIMLYACIPLAFGWTPAI